MELLRPLQAQLSAIAPLVGISIGRRDDRSTWRIDFSAEATADQRAAAQAALEAFDLSAADREAKIISVKERCQADILEQFPYWRQINALSESLQAVGEVTGLLGKLDSLPIPTEQRETIRAGLEMAAAIKARRAQSDAEEAALTEAANVH